MSSSVVSYALTPISEFMPGLNVSNYEIPAAENGRPSILVVEDTYYVKHDIEGNPDRVHVPDVQIAESIVTMFLRSQLNYRHDSHPAVFAILKEAVTPVDLETKYKKLVTDALAKQRAYFISLVRMADDDWQQVKRHQMISDIQRKAAKALGLTNREWVNSVPDVESVNQGCPFCGRDLLNPEAPICPHCGKVHNPARMRELESKFEANTKVARV